MVVHILAQSNLNYFVLQDGHSRALVPLPYLSVRRSILANSWCHNAMSNLDKYIILTKLFNCLLTDLCKLFQYFTVVHRHKTKLLFLGYKLFAEPYEKEFEQGSQSRS